MNDDSCKKMSLYLKKWSTYLLHLLTQCVLIWKYFFELMKTEQTQFADQRQQDTAE